MERILHIRNSGTDNMLWESTKNITHAKQIEFGVGATHFLSPPVPLTLMHVVLSYCV